MQRVFALLLVFAFATSGLAGCATPYNKPQTVPRIGQETRGSGADQPTSPPVVTAPQTAPPVVTSPGTYGGAAVGGAVGAGAGALIDRNNRWRGALIGGAVGAVLGGTVTEIRNRAAREAVVENRPVAYQTEDGWQRVEVTPRGEPSARGCRQVHERIYQDGQLVQDTVREVCG